MRNRAKERDRRNLTDADISRCIEAVDELKERGGDHKSVEFKTALELVKPEDQKSKTSVGVFDPNLEIEEVKFPKYKPKKTKKREDKSAAYTANVVGTSGRASDELPKPMPPSPRPRTLDIRADPSS